jgi:predicted metal-dependent enzyme (double-stranded beta helix superfamily)
VFDLDQFVADCTVAKDESEPFPAVREVLERAMADRDGLLERFEQDRAGLELLHHTPELTILHIVWAPGMRLFAHDHRMWAAIGVYHGQEDNEFFRRPDGGPQGLVPANGTTLQPGDVTLLGRETIHAVSNPGSVPTAALHVYGGDFVNQPRSQWVPPELVEEPYDQQRVTEVFAEANAAWSR